MGTVLRFPSREPPPEEPPSEEPEVQQPATFEEWAPVQLAHVMSLLTDMDEAIADEAEDRFWAIAGEVKEVIQSWGDPDG